MNEAKGIDYCDLWPLFMLLLACEDAFRYLYSLWEFADVICTSCINQRGGLVVTPLAVALWDPGSNPGSR